MRRVLLCLCLLWSGCSAKAQRLDAGEGADTGVIAVADAGTIDASADAASPDAETDAGTATPDASTPEACRPPAAAGPLDVVTTHATVRGEALGADLRRHRGIRYAAPPVGELRWRAPAPPACAPAVVDALDYGPRCPQLDPDRGTFAGAEDCLTVDVWSPAAPAEPQPVMVFVHGGGNIVGAASEAAFGAEPTFDGEVLARAQGAVVVTLQYRLGALGFFAHEALGEGGANWGLQDQVAALRWVQDNIAAFGGDPTRVLVFGESAGAANVCALLTMPSARGLFSAALMQSGGCGQPPLAERRAQGLELVEAAQCAGAAEPIACLRALGAEAVVRARPGVIDVATGRGTDWGPAVDGALLPESPADAIAAGRDHPVPVIIGANLDETARSVAPIASCAAYEALVRRHFPAGANAVLAIYPCADYPTPRDAFVALTSDLRFICPSRAVARARVRAGTAPLYRYFFTHHLDNARQQQGAFHGLELAFVFGHLATPLYQPSAGELELSAAMGGYWARFAATGDPNGDGALAWPEYDASGDLHLELATPVRAADGVRAAQCDAWDRLR